jgi:hypothetical protein
MKEKPGAILEGIAERNRRLHDIEIQLGIARATPAAIDKECEALEVQALERADALRARLDGEAVEARAVVAELADGPLVFTSESTPEGRRYRITGKIDTTPLLVAGSGNEEEGDAQSGTSPQGFAREHMPRVEFRLRSAS